MTSVISHPRVPTSFGTRVRVSAAQGSPALLSLIALAIIFVIAVAMQPAILSVNGLTLMLMSSVPLVFAAQAQMMIMSVGDIDLGIGNLIGLVTVIAATFLQSAPTVGVLLLLGIVVAYALTGLVIQKRGVPAIIVTLGLSFVWLGIGLQLLPTPGGQTPSWVSAIGSWRPDWIPSPIVFIAIACLVGWYIARFSRIGVRIRALGSSPTTLTKLGWSLTATRVTAYVLAAVLIIVSGLLLASQTRSGDINSAGSFTLMTIAAVILGGGNFAGGRALPIGAALGAVTLGLITVLLSFANLPSSVQSAAQGIVVLAVLAGRIITERIARA
ncbi:MULTISPECIES: ABC transporter permease [unclassified Microbacterium]|uniref:ABC transporter permease n=1 Tax=unclassified Microbacterium TaxID=2609290 RepID=UPI00097EA464|nr:ABC transporter permease [Microbacterium sp. JB110]RCS58839.1 ABC transporter permease [Microbacterium sp. JB110]SJM54977.1 Ribose ABC transport system, permease protein RbsC (TC 3.A.1.2.1) [Frigoribacterium sp. JB110]